MKRKEVKKPCAPAETSARKIQQIKPQEPEWESITLSVEPREAEVEPSINQNKQLERKSSPQLPRRTKLVEPSLYPVRKSKISNGASGVYNIKIKVIGIGGGGSSIVSEIASKIERVDFVVADTDQQALKEATPKVKRFRFGQSLTRGLGTGVKPELGEAAAKAQKEKIKELFEGQDLCILISCLGGGVGSGASPVFAEISQGLKNITLGIFTLPFEFEGKRKMEIAQASLERLKPNLNAFILIPNERIFQIVEKETSLKEAFSTINKFLVENLEGLIEMLYSSGLINVGWADLRTILKGKGKLAYLNTAELKSSGQIEKAVERIISNPLFPYSVQGASEILFNIEGGLNLNIGQVGQISKIISSPINPQAKVAFGISPKERKGIKITLLANGCKWEEWEKPLESPKVPQAEISQNIVEE